MMLLQLLPLCSLLCALSSTRATCRFPEFLQREEPWAADYGEGTFVAYVKGTYMQINQIKGGSGSAYARRCIQKTSNGKYLVTHEEKQKEHRFVCMQFLRRSANIVQLKVSRNSNRRSIDLCQDRLMALDHWPIVQLSQTPDQRITCPFVGGYNVQMQFPNHTIVCADHLLLLRIESECEKGEGILFDFRDEQCIPPSLPRDVKQRAYCIAHWEENGQTFVILQHATVHKQMWCLRISDALGDMKGAYLMLDLVCHPNESEEETLNYYYISIEKQVHSSICADAVDGCSLIKDFCDTDFRQHCSKTCRDCEYESEIGLCTFPEHMRGKWIDAKGSRENEINIYDYSMNINDIGRFQCLEMQSDYYRDRRVLLELFDNGCYPRYACVELEKIALPVMKYRLGRRLDWPLIPTHDQKKLICDDERFKSKPNSLYDNSLKPPRLLIRKEKIHYVSCGLPPSLQYGLSFREEGEDCGGCLYYSPVHEDDSIKVQPVNCSSPNLSIDYRCVASFQFGNDTHAVVAKSRDTYLCWVFTDDSKIKVLTAGDCFSYELMETAKLQGYFTITEENLCQNIMRVLKTTTTTTEKTTQITSTLGRIEYTVIAPEEAEIEVEQEPIITPSSSVGNGAILSTTPLSYHMLFLLIPCLVFILRHRLS
ncbi:uncharacterized protein LOC124147718 [Haliotis rufescens]|uniref:uncharacterized protein LOC124147718 n=1 Tax=Haliotis rufescens TaxID=6454 RepID=UPI001EB09EF9|nr:uncharacterized protein LOC124147718 [Haliotis rufescens]XP_048237123.1 uncharacterized protein LOC124147718 [Haliotis rufescens]XP_048237124.1 uncharacterized protein LOC124147718 [Haliotis rufescens]